MPGSDDRRAAAAGRLFPSDVTAVVERRAREFATLRGTRIFMTGGTGFVGRWLLHVLLAADATLELGTEVTLLTRDPSAFISRYPYLAAAPRVKLVRGDVRSFDLPTNGFDRVLHLAAETNTTLRNPPPEEYFDVIVDGTRRVLDVAERTGAGSFLLVSSGAVYGKPSTSHLRLGEEDPYGPPPTDLRSAYGEAKRCAELLACARAARCGFVATVARCFAFVGPYIPVDSGFAVGNFIRDAVMGREIVVRGDGLPIRTFLYAADMAEWLWTIAITGGCCRPYNVGSNEEITIGDLARTIARLADSGARVRVLGDSTLVGVGASYVPDVTRAKAELGLAVTVHLEEALRRTVDWYRIRYGSSQWALFR